MVHINRNNLPARDLTRLLDQFDRTLIQCGTSLTTQFLNELLGKEERLTLAKRLATIVLLHEGYSENKTSRILKLSTSTTSAIATKMKSGSYTHILTLFKKKRKNYLEILNTLDSILHLGGILPRRVGLDRYRSYEERVHARKSGTT